MLAAGCGKPPAVEAPAAPRVPEVQTVRPRRLSLPRTVEQPARIEPFEETPIHAKIAGYVRAVHVQTGSRVGKGDVLAEMRVPVREEELEQKKAEVARAEVAIKQADKALLVARAAIVTAKSLVKEAEAGRRRAGASYERWKSESARMDDLVRSKVISPQSRDETLNQFRAAGAAREEAEARIHSAEAAQAECEAKAAKAETDLEGARAQLRLAEADRRRAAALFAYAKIRAPYAGVVTQRDVHTGHLPQPTPGAGAKTPLFVMARTDKVRVFLDVPERDAVLVHDGTPVRIRVQALNDEEFTGKVAGSSWVLDPVQRTLRTEVDFDNPGERLRPGMYAHALLDVVDPGAMTLPAAAVLTRDGQAFCYCVEKGRAVRTPLRVGPRHGDVVEVLKKRSRPGANGAAGRWVDLTGTEAVIVKNAGELTPGQEVRVTGEVPIPAAAAGQ